MLRDVRSEATADHLTIFQTRVLVLWLSCRLSYHTNRMLCGSEQEEQELLRTVMDAEGKETGRDKGPVVVWAGVC